MYFHIRALRVKELLSNLFSIFLTNCFAPMREGVTSVED